MGTGLGLSIVKNMLELHGAMYGVESEVNKGSTFWFELNCVNRICEK
jgi:signal transduction histidine kinase